MLKKIECILSGSMNNQSEIWKKIKGFFREPYRWILKVPASGSTTKNDVVLLKKKKKAFYCWSFENPNCFFFFKESKWFFYYCFLNKRPYLVFQIMKMIANRIHLENFLTTFLFLFFSSFFFFVCLMRVYKLGLFNASITTCAGSS